MKKSTFFETKVAYCINLGVAYALLLFLFSLRSMFAFVEHYTFPYAAYVLLGLVAADVLFCFYLFHVRRGKKALIATLAINSVLLVGVWAWEIAVIDLIAFMALEFAYGLAYTFPIMLLLFVVAEPKPVKKVAKIALYAVTATVMLGSFFFVTDIRANAISADAVVYAVEDEYQIVWSTDAECAGWVEIDGVQYADTSDGALVCDTKVHKVTVPMSVLDAAKSYKVVSRAMVDRQPYGAFWGKTVSSSHSFRPVDDSDGVQYITLADVHSFKKAATKVGGYYGDKLDFLILAGDISSFLTRRQHVEFIGKLANAVTGGSRPVIFARGNHETKGDFADDLSRYVGAADGDKLYYTFRLASVWGVVLDFGECYADDWFEFANTARYEPYRQAQMDFLQSIIDNKYDEYAASGVRHRIAVSHQATSFVLAPDAFLSEVNNEATKKLNQMGIDMMYGGHLHEIMYLDGGISAGKMLDFHRPSPQKEDWKFNLTATGANFPTVLVSRKSDTQFDKKVKLGSKFIGGASEFAGGKLHFDFVNANGAVVDYEQAWY